VYANNAVSQCLDLTVTRVCIYPPTEHQHPIQRDMATALLIGSTYFVIVATLGGISKMNNAVNSANSRRTHKTEELGDLGKNFQKNWTKSRLLGRGSDGVVHCYEHKPTGGCVAVKEPIMDTGSRLDSGLKQEVRNLQIVGRHENIISMLGYKDGWIPSGPAIIYTICDLGDLSHYRWSWIQQERNENRPTRISEDTVWKLLHDMALALDHVHNKLGDCRYVHTDVKPDNILVVTPSDYMGENPIPKEPLFKLADFTRLQSYPPSKESRGWSGTYEYAPPLDERSKAVRPAIDIWSLGATLQELALGICPVQSREAYVKLMKQKGEEFPYPTHPSCAEAWKTSAIRARLPVVFRPLHVSMEELQANYDVQVSIRDYQPFSCEINTWYGKLLAKKPRHRTTAAALVLDFVPLVAQKMEKAAKERRETEISHTKTKLLDRKPSYEGNGYGSGY
jgi:serine/threonine protein kinase